jgi:hypothetical protein
MSPEYFCIERERHGVRSLQRNELSDTLSSFRSFGAVDRNRGRIHNAGSERNATENTLAAPGTE